MTAHVGDIVRVSGQAGDWRVLALGVAIGTHKPTACLECVGESWVHKLTVPAAVLYPAILLGGRLS